MIGCVVIRLRSAPWKNHDLVICEYVFKHKLAKHVTLFDRFPIIGFADRFAVIPVHH
jgi:hypothetical protein